jgi:NAD(P)-dependent dehydrogenase (short-subunit alcohol dehydrogenase family)
MSSELDMSGKVAIVTGGSRGVGRGVVERFLDAGAEVVICGRKQPDALPERDGRRALFAAADVRDLEQIDGVVDLAIERFGRLDVLVNNAGGAPPADAATASPRFSEAILRLNLIAPLNFAQKANAVMQKQDEGGVILNIASVSALRPSPGAAAYGAAKAGLLSLTQTLAVEWAPKVRVNAVTAGMIRTEQSRLHYGDEEGIRAVGATVPLGRMGEPRDVGDVCLFLASSLASYVSGASILMHGGGEKPAYLGAAKPEPD